TTVVASSTVAWELLHDGDDYEVHCHVDVRHDNRPKMAKRRLKVVIISRRYKDMDLCQYKIQRFSIRTPMVIERLTIELTDV
ncbi:hypothetical protein Tco_0438455, partial [Tanacetum coccineum]